MWTGIISLEGTEYYTLAPLTVVIVVGLPLLLLNRLFLILFNSFGGLLTDASANI